ncbi:hypothetical protein DICSQDRAFT_160407 [Dichomitus squalens LYAD-421 SS1]|uniref:uncharacterized protein n=1 Tax=Dichomitus squalens (strain LYAD-421) TaxID=732165 RepID=UPI0004411B96|nr:uncharacterized protein DICSQDRAFT_160407 [Dichomitus squalens LYAD-421 SS1]EJF63955.1 hypothetical protein DICSQDRAFT_160407 [Dichomitus squalens LYAD-421 SS1]
MDSPTKHYADLKPFSAHTSLPTHITTPAQQTTRAEEAQPAKTARRSRMSANRGITVHKLALELPQACSPSNSLSTFINALEDASPGWYQSLMDSALPHSGSYSPLASPQSSSSFSKSLTESVGSGTSLPKDGLPCDMLGAMRELEELATAVRHLPIPTLRTVVVDWVVSPLTPDVSTTPASERKHLTLPPVTSTSSTLIRPGERKSAPAVRSKEVLRETLPSDYRAPSAYAPSPNQPAIDNLVYHPKLSKTLGLRSLPSWGASGTAAPQTPTPQGGFDGGLHSPQSYWEDYRSPSGKDLPTSVERLPENHLPSKTPKSYKIASFFRRRPTAAAVVEDWPEYRRDPALRATHVPESVPRVLRSAPDGPANKGSSRSSPILEPPPSLGHRQLDSFLQM